MTTEEPENLQVYLPHAEITPQSNYRGREIPEGINCPDCGYDLRGLKRGQPCPECGRPTIRVGDDLGYSDIAVEKLKNTTNGLRLIILGWWGIFATPIIAIIMSFTDTKVMYFVDAGLFLTAWGVWKITMPGVLMQAAGTTLSLRQLITRVFIGTSTGAFLVFQSFAQGTTVFTDPLAWFVLFLLTFLAAQGLISMECSGLSRFSKYEPLDIKFQTIAWLILIAGIASMLFFVLTAGSMSNIFVVLGLLSSFLFLCFEIAFAILLRSLKNEFILAVRYQKQRAVGKEHQG